MRGRWAGGAFQVRSNSPIVFFPGMLKLSPQKVGERGSEKTSGGANDQAILNAPETHLRAARELANHTATATQNLSTRSLYDAV